VLADRESPRVAGQRVLVAAAIAVVVALAGLLATVGADAQWLAALGHTIVAHGAIPKGVPFAAAPTGNWPNVLVLAELVFNGLQAALGDRGLMLAQLLAVAVAMWVLARDARDGGAEPAGIAAALLLAGVGALPSLAIVRVQLFSLALFPILVALLRAESRRPSRRIWLVVPLIAVWSNLHGGALLGEAIVLAYLLLSRLRHERGLSLAVAGSSIVALSLTPALWRTAAYYHGVVTNVAAQRGEGMWAGLSLTAPLDLVLIVAGLALAFRLLRARPALWEWCVIAALFLLTVQAARNGVWLLFFLVAPAARTIHPKRTWIGLAPIAAAASVAAIGFAVVRGPAAGGASHAVLAEAISMAGGSPVLADGSIDEQVSLAGGRIWVGNPIDAFSRADQATYLDWIDGAPAGRRALGAEVRIVLVTRGTGAQRLTRDTPGYELVGGDAATAIYQRLG
jgi:hypothetical protein